MHGKMQKSIGDKKEKAKYVQKLFLSYIHFEEAQHESTKGQNIGLKTKETDRRERKRKKTNKNKAEKEVSKI